MNTTTTTTLCNLSTMSSQKWLAACESYELRGEVAKAEDCRQAAAVAAALWASAVGACSASDDGSDDGSDAALDAARDALRDALALEREWGDGSDALEALDALALLV